MDAQEIAYLMYNKDTFSKWLGIKILNIEKGSCTLSMQIRDEMLNGFGIAHGGITYSLADSAFAFACNSLGDHAVSIETSISHLKSLKSGDQLIAIAKEKSRSRKIGFYEIEIHSSDKLVALFKGTCYVKDKKWE
jgi:acyl-CoA thioesterase